jgi:hypothetical protein
MWKLGAIVVGGLCVAAVTAWVASHFLPPWGYGAEAASVAVTGILAALVAIWALYSQRAITRRQCTLEHIARLESDGDLIRGRRRFRELTQHPDKMGELASPKPEQIEDFQYVTTHLNEFELISIGIQRGIIDFELYKLWFKSGTVTAWYEAEPFVKKLRTKHNNTMLFNEFQQMVAWFEKDSRPARSRWLGTFF